MNWRTALFVLAAGSPAWADCSNGVTELRWAGGQARFTVEIADDVPERARGLMYRKAMPSGSGMLFVYDHPQNVAFWMKNTLIPLDLLFIGADGTVVRIKDKAKPGDETPIPGGQKVQFVLEINGGLAARLGLVEGAVMRHPAVPQETAKWPCKAH
jgi:uncharacterized membrane protein (UPF0127 family)